MKRYFSGSPWESKVGYCRVIQMGSFISVAGTAPIDDSGNTYCPNKPYEQTVRCLELIQKALEQAGANLSDVYRTKMYVTDITKWEDYGRAHAEKFHKTPPVSAMVEVSRLIGEGMMIEIEVEAYKELKV